jgi:hypothetical protein
MGRARKPVARNELLCDVDVGDTVCRNHRIETQEIESDGESGKKHQYQQEGIISLDS